MKESNLKWWVLLTVIVGTFLGRLDQTIVNLALPKIITDFRITVSAAGWIATAYIIANAIFVPVWGKLGDTLGRKKIYIFGFSIFIFGSILAGISWNLSSMIAFRIIQAIASSADYPTAMAIVAITFREGKERAQALGLWSSSFAAASVFGPLIGGPLIDFFGWRSVFLVNLPIGILGIFMAVTFIKESVSGRKDIEFDWFGAVILGVCLSSLVLVLDQGITWGWFSLYSILCYIVIISSGIWFYHIEINHKEPIVDFKFFKNKVFTWTLINNFIVFMGLIGSVFLIPVFAQTFMGYNATQAGYLFIPMALFLVVAAQIGGRMVGKVKSNYIIFASTLVGAFGIFLFSVFLDPRTGPFGIMIPLSIMSFGIGFGMAQRTSAIASSVPENEIGIASSVLALARNIAGAFGIAIFATILNSQINKKVLTYAANTIINSHSPIVYKQVAALIILKAQVAGYASVFLICSFVVLLGAAAALFIKVKNKSQAHGHIDLE